MSCSEENVSRSCMKPQLNPENASAAMEVKKIKKTKQLQRDFRYGVLWYRLLNLYCSKDD